MNWSAAVIAALSILIDLFDSCNALYLRHASLKIGSLNSSNAFPTTASGSTMIPSSSSAKTESE